MTPELTHDNEVAGAALAMPLLAVPSTTVGLRHCALVVQGAGCRDEEVVMTNKGGKAKKAAKPGASEQTKAKFREALERKHAHGGRDVSADGEGSKVHQAHGPAQAQRMFRRKAGG